MDQKLSLRLGVEGSDTAQGEVSALRSEFVKLLEQTGKSPKDIAAFFAIAEDSKKAAAGVDQLDDKTQELLKTYQTLKSVASARDTLNLIPHDKIKKEIDDVKRAYETLKTSGTLSHKELAQAALKTETAIRQLEGQTNGLADSFAQIKGSVAGTAAAFGGLTLAAKQAIDFESAMADVRKTVDGTDEQMAALAKTIKDLSGELPISADGLAQIAAAGGQLGVPIEKIAEFTRLAATMATAFGMSAEEAGQSVAKLANVFNLPMEGVRSLGDSINVLGNNTAATEKAIVDVLTRIGGSAVQFGLAGDQAAALAATMLSLGAAPEVVATGLNAMMSRLQTANVQSDEFKSTLKGLGIQAEDLADRISKKPQEALLEFMKTLEGLDKQSRAEALVKLFGLEYQDDIAKLVGAMGQYQTALGLIGDQTKVAGAMQDEFSTRMQTTEAQIQLLKNAIEVIAINLGSVFLPIVKSAAEGVTDISRAIAGFVESYPVISGLISVVGTLAVSLGTLKVASLAARVAFGTLLDDLPGKFAAMNASVMSSVEHLGKLKTAGLLAGAAFVGWEIGTKLSDEFAIVRQAGVALVAGLVEGAEYVRYAWEVAKAVIGDDTIEAATQRHTERLAEIRDILTQQFIDAGKELKTSADQLTTAHQQTGQAATQAGAAQTVAANEALAAQTALAGALKSLGVEGEKVGADIAGAFTTVASSADASAETIWQAFQAALKKAGSVEELEGLKSALKATGDTGKLASEQISAGFAALDKQLAATTAAVDPVQQALAALGVKSAAVLAQAAEEAKAHFTTIAESGSATSKELEAAFAAYAKAAIAAAEMVSPAEKEATKTTLEHEAAAINLKNASEDLANAQKKTTAQTNDSAAAMKDGTAQINSHAEAATDGAGAVMDLGSSAEKATAWIDEMGHEAYDSAKETDLLADSSKETAKAIDGVAYSAVRLGNKLAGNFSVDISGSRQAMEDLKGMVESLNRELLGLQGAEEDLENIAYKERIAEIEKLYRDSRTGAIKFGTTDEYEKALSLARQIHEQEIDNIRKKKAAEEASAKEASAKAASAKEAKAPETSKQSEITKKVQIDFGGYASGEFSEADAAKLLELLKSYGAKMV